MDVKSAYLNSPDAAIYMRLPPGYGSKGKVALVKKGIYGLRQSGNLWHKTLTTAFDALGLTRSAVDHGVFYNHDNEGTTIVRSSTDDFAITGSPTSRISKFKSDLSNHFEMSDLGELAWILGIQVKRDRISKSITLSQAAYIDTVVKRFNLESASPLQTPIDPSIHLSKEQSPATPRQYDNMRNVPYREAVGSLMYAAIGTRPDITYAVTALSQYLQNPGRAHWEQVNRAIRYLKGTRTYELTFGPSGGMKASPMPTGVMILTTATRFADTCSRSTKALSPGHPRNNPWSLYPARKPSTLVSRTLRRKRSGFATSSRNSTLRSFLTIPSRSSATTSPPSSSSKMRPFTHGPSTSRSVTTTSARLTTKDLSFSTTAELTICRPASSPNL